MITQAINLNLIPGQVLPRVNVSQYDSGTRTLQLSVFNGTQAFNITSGINGFIQGTKPDRTGFQYSATVTEGSNVVTADITQQMTAVSGEVTCELVLASGNDRIATVNFIIYVEPAALADDTVISDTELPLIEEAAELAQRIDGIVADVEDDADRAEAAVEHYPYIGANGNWYVFDVQTEQFVDTTIAATGPQGPTGPTGPTGQTGATGPTGNGIQSITKTGTSGLVDTYTITMTDGTTSTFTVTNGAGDMNKSVYDPTNAIANAGGMKSAAAKNSTNAVTSGSTDLVESGAVYARTEPLWDNMMDNGAVNLLENKGTTQTINGVTFTANSDGTIIANGANTSTSAFVYVIDEISDNFVLPAGSYKLTGCPSNGGENTWRLQAYKTDGTTSVAIDRGNGAAFTLTEPTQLVVKIRIAGSGGSGTLTNLTFKPMISDPSLNLSYDDYVPYAMTNRELTEDMATKATIIGDSGWKNNATITCNMGSGGLCYLFTEAGMIKLSTASNTINRADLAINAQNAYFNESGSGLTKTYSCYSDSTFQTDRNTIWRLMPLVGNWTMTHS